LYCAKSKKQVFLERTSPQNPRVKTRTRNENYELGLAVFSLTRKDVPLSLSRGERFPRKRFSLFEPMNPEPVDLLPLPVRRGEGWGEGFMGRVGVRGKDALD
jgi:hypothetical protein